MRKTVLLSMALLAAISLSATSASKADEPYKIGFLGGLSGFLGPFDDPVLKGMQAAADDLNKQGGIDGKYPIEISVVDSKSDPAQAQIAATSLIDEGVKFLVGPCSTDVGLPAAQLSQDAGIPFIASCSADTEFPSKVGDTAFLMGPGGTAEGEALAEYAYKVMGLKTAYVVTSKDLVFTQQTSDGFTKAFEKLGGKILQTDYVKLWQPSQAAEVTKIKAMNPQPDAIMTSLFVPDMPGFVKDLRAAGVTAPLFLNEGNDTSLFLSSGVDLGDVTIATIGIAEAGSKLEQLNKLYEAKFGKAPESTFVGLGGDIIAVVDEAVTQAGSTEPADVRTALSELADFDAVTTKVTFKGTDGVPKRDVFLIGPKKDNSGFELKQTLLPGSSSQ